MSIFPSGGKVLYTSLHFADAIVHVFIFVSCG
jgi:hypothetical protein